MIVLIHSYIFTRITSKLSLYISHTASEPDKLLTKLFDTPLRYGLEDRGLDFSSPKYDQGPAAFFLSPKLTDEKIAAIIKNKTDEITCGLFDNILGPHPDSSKVPEPFRNGLFWMDGNPYAEELVSLNRWAWRSQSYEENPNGRVIGVGSMSTDWSNDPTVYGTIGANIRSFFTLQESPCKKWYVFGLFLVDEEWKVIRNMGLQTMKMYVVQEGDEFIDRFGKKVEYLTPGSIVRMNHGSTDPYDLAPANMTLQYALRKIAKYNESNGKIEPVSPGYDALMKKVANEPPEGFTTFKYLTRQERYDLVTSIVSDRQLYRSALPPPFGDEIENF